MSKRESIRKSVRFEVFKRDSFTCQYCGAKAPEAILHVDHINPVSKGGDNEIINLVTACQECNSGKSDRLLSDTAAIDKQRAQLEELNSRREQLEMMLSWRDSLTDLKEELVDETALRIEQFIPGHTINESGKNHIRRWLKKYSFDEIMDAAEIADEKLPVHPDQEDVDSFFHSIPKICAVKRMPETDQRLRYARGILRNRIYVNENQVMRLMQDAVAAGIGVEDLVEFTKEVLNWTEFKAEMEAIANG